MAGPAVTCQACRDYWPRLAQVVRDGPWEGPEAASPGGLPRSPQRLLKAAQEAGWGFGCISLVMRFNHPRWPRFYMAWNYDPGTGRWAFENARDQLGNPLDVTGAIELLTLTKEAPDATA
jgi:hypothetical protein